MGLVTDILLPPFLFPFRLLTCWRRPLRQNSDLFLDEQAVSVVELETEEGEREVSRKLHFMNHEFGASLRSNQASECDFALLKRLSQISRMGSSRTQQPSPFSQGPMQVDVLLEPSAFAYQTVPYKTGDKMLCSRDDSEIAVQTNYDLEDDPNGLFTGQENNNKTYANAMYLYTKNSCDDMEIGMFTNGKTPLRRMGSAYIYRTELTSKDSQFVSEQCSGCSPGQSFDQDLTQSLRLRGTKERNKIIRLESIVGRAHTPNNSVIEIGVVDSRTGELFERTCKNPSLVSNLKTQNPCTDLPTESSRPVLVKSYPLPLLSRLSEEDEESENGDTKENLLSKEMPAESPRPNCFRENRASIDQGGYSRSLHRRFSSRSSCRFRIMSIDFDKAGLNNPYYEFPEELYSIEVDQDFDIEKFYSQKFETKELRESRKLASLPSGAEPKTFKSDSSQPFLLERYLAHSYVNATSYQDSGYN